MDDRPASYVGPASLRSRGAELPREPRARPCEPGMDLRAASPRRTGFVGDVGDVRICAPFWAPSGFDSGRRKPRSASTSMRIERKMWSGKCGWSLVVKRDAAGSVIHAGKQANEPSG